MFTICACCSTKWATTSTSNFPPGLPQRKPPESFVFGMLLGSLAGGKPTGKLQVSKFLQPTTQAPQILRTADADAPSLTKDAERPLDGIFLPFLVNNPASWPHDVDTRALYISSSMTYIRIRAHQGFAN